MSIPDDPSQAQPSEPVTSGPAASGPVTSEPGTTPAVTGTASIGDALARLRQGIILGFIVLLVISIGSVVLAFMSRSEVAALQEQVSALQASAAAATQQPSTEPEPATGATAAPGIAEPGIAEPMRLQGTKPRGADEFGALLIGDRGGSSVVEVFVDFQCPFCQRWDQELGDALISQALTEGSNLLVKVNPLAFLGETTADLSVPGASARAANAAACIAEHEEPAVLARYVAGVYEAADPSEPPGQFPPSQLVSIATGAGAGTQTTECIRTGDFIGYVAEVTRNSFVRGVGGTPTVVLNGSLVEDPFRSQELLALAANPRS